MIRELVRTLTRPLTLLLGTGLRAIAARRLGPAGVLELRLDSSIKQPLLLLRHIEELAEAPGVRGLLLHVGSLGWGWGTIQEWREGLDRLRDAGMVVFVNADTPGNGEMLLATAADKLIVPPMGEVGMVGVGGQMRFVGPLLQRFGLRFEVEAAGEYKSFGETFTRAYASPENREAVQRLVDDLHEALVGGISRSRRKPAEEVQQLIDRCPMSPEEALEAGLVDVVGYDDDIDRELEALLGDRVRRVDITRMAWLVRGMTRLEDFMATQSNIAVVHLQGNITMARSPTASPRIAPHEVIPALRLVRDDPRVKAVVLAVQSGGGSVLASDLIWHEVRKLQEEKPVIASFGDVAASGGYYISAPATAIVARPGTLTGSIGVVGGKLVTGEATRSLGIYAEDIHRGRNVGMYSTEHPFDDHQRARFRQRLLDTYEGFLERVGSGRNKTRDEVDEVARGRVWTGAAALDAGLVDHLGGLQEALRRARQEAGLGPQDPWRRTDLVVRPRRHWVLELIPQAAQAAQAMIPKAFGALSLPNAARMLLDHPDEPLVMLPGDLDIR